jgi:hypothetical protein
MSIRREKNPKLKMSKKFFVLLTRSVSLSKNEEIFLAPSFKIFLALIQLCLNRLERFHRFTFRPLPNIIGDCLTCLKWKRINHKQHARWQHLSRLKASAFSLQKHLASCNKCNNLYSGLVTPSSG